MTYDLTFVIRDLTGVTGGFALDADGIIVDWPEGIAQPSKDDVSAHGPVYAAKVVELERKASTMAQIKELEASVTPRRLREAVLGDNGWLNSVNAHIAALRASL